ncbi:MAG: hypothetical protein JXQ75_04975 [Phycisphaerae bacterium]|nr:hypothetical protein [Phycisphaerae bacterium]
MLSLITACAVGFAYPGRSVLRASMLGAFALAPVVIYVVLVGRYAINIPILDDYDTILAHLLRPSSERLRGLLDQHNEHRILVTRGLAEITYRLLGHADFRVVIYAGNAALLAIAAALVYLIRRCGVPLAACLPMMWVLFLSQSQENMTWATGATTNYYVMLFGLLSLVCFGLRSLPGLAMGLVFGFLATFTNMAGICIWPVLVAWHVLVGDKTEPLREQASRLRRWLGPETLLLVVGVVGTLVLYFHQHHSPAEESALAEAVRHPFRTTGYFLTVTGGCMHVGMVPFIRGYIFSQVLTVVLGTMVVAYFVFLSVTGYYRRRPTVYFLLLYALLIAASIALGRSRYGIGHALASRYRLVSIMVLIGCYLSIIDLYLERLRRPGLFVGIVTAACVSLNAYFLDFAIPILSSRSEMLQSQVAAWAAGTGRLTHPNPASASKILSRAIRQGIYRVPDEVKRQTGNARFRRPLADPERSRKQQPASDEFSRRLTRGPSPYEGYCSRT